LESILESLGSRATLANKKKFFFEQIGKTKYKTCKSKQKQKVTFFFGFPRLILSLTDFEILGR
jgi:hypothetical protein